jgi:hypothetical protein
MSVHNNYRIGDIGTKYNVEGTKGEAYGGVASTDILESRKNICDGLSKTNYAKDLGALKVAAADARPHVVRSLLRGFGRGIASTVGRGLKVGVSVASGGINLTKITSAAIAITWAGAAICGGGMPAVGYFLAYTSISAAIQGLQTIYNSTKNAIEDSIISSAISSRLQTIAGASELLKNVEQAEMSGVKNLAKFVDTLERNVDKLEKKHDSRNLNNCSDKENIKQRREYWQDRVFIRDSREKILDRMEELGQTGTKEYKDTLIKLGRAAGKELNSFKKLENS